MSSRRRLYFRWLMLCVAVVGVLWGIALWWPGDSGDSEVGDGQGAQEVATDGGERGEGLGGLPTESSIGTVPFADEADAGRSQKLKGVFLEGRVIAKATGAPMSGAVVGFQAIGDSDTLKQTVAGDDGRFTIGPIIGVSTYLCAARMDGFEPSTATKRVKLKELADGETGDIGEIALSQAAVLKGRVVDDLSGVAIEGANLACGHQYARNQILELRGLSSASGSFSFSEYSTGHHRDLMISAEGYAHHVQSLGSNEVVGGKVTDLGEIRLVRGALVTGRVVDAERGSPIAGAAIFLVRLTMGGPFYRESQCQRVGTSADDGSFSLPHIPPFFSSYRLVAATAHGCGWKQIDVQKGTAEVRAVELELSAGAALEIEVVDPLGEPIPGVLLKAVPTFAPLQLYRSDSVHPRMRCPAEFEALFGATTDEGGRATFTHLPCSEDGRPYDLALWKRGWPKASVELKVRTENPTLSVTLYPTQRQVIRGTVTHEDGSPFQGAKAALTWRKHHVMTGDDGSFELEIPNVGVDRERVSVSAKGYADVHQRVALKPGKLPEPCKFVLRRAAPIAGRLVDEAGAPIKGIQVDIDPAGKERQPHFMVQTDQNGKFAFHHTTAGLWNVRVRFVDDEKKWQRPLPSVNAEGGNGDVRLLMKRAETSAITLTADLRDANSHEPVTAQPRGTWIRNRFRGGSFPLEIRAGQVVAEGLPPGEWRLRVQLKDGRAMERDVVATTAKPDLRMTLRLGASGGIAGRVRFEGMERPKSVFVLTENKGRGVLKDGSSVGNFTPGFVPLGADGSFYFADITPGPLIITVQGSGLQMRKQIQVPVGEVVSVELVAKPAGTLVFRGEIDPAITSVHIWTQAKEGPWVRSGLIRDLALKSEEIRLDVEAGPVRYRIHFEPESAREMLTAEVEVAAQQELVVAF